MPQTDTMPTGKAAAYLGVSAETLRRWSASGRVAHVTLPSGRRRYTTADLDAALQRRPAEAGAA